MVQQADSNAEFFPGISKIEYKPDGGPGIISALNTTIRKRWLWEKTMEEWCRFSVCFWHTFRGTGADPFGFLQFTTLGRRKQQLGKCKKKIKSSV
ncbi:hypothetical protein OS493_009223 [Desmophyllum pertusum]|uniref:xylose isomerase n=1 Tax=Desmophyllum pertusum TaxID=174260 RepID=A0A9W9Z5S9_9CNID|nr:hypothetical protein OS493_009223 [Desmophyllum pertusum]